MCPEGWHLPDTTEWNALFTAVGGKETAGTMLKSTEGWENRGNGPDAYSFSALPAGYRLYNGDYSLEGHNALFWSSTEVNSNDACSMYLYYILDNALLNYYDKRYGFFVFPLLVKSLYKTSTLSPAKGTCSAGCGCREGIKKAPRKVYLLGGVNPATPYSPGPGGQVPSAKRGLTAVFGFSLCS